jgi:hypothetical protein
MEFAIIFNWDELPKKTRQKIYLVCDTELTMIFDWDEGPQQANLKKLVFPISLT